MAETLGSCSIFLKRTCAIQMCPEVFTWRKPAGKGETFSKAFLRNYSQKFLNLLSQSGFMLFYSICFWQFGSLLHFGIFWVCLFQESLRIHTILSTTTAGWVRDSRRDVNALLDDFKNSHEHFFKCLAGSWGVVFEVFNKWIQISIYFVENPQCFVLFQFYRFFCWMNLGHQGWAFAMVTRHSFRNDGSKTESVFFPERREPMSCICCSATPFLIRISMYNGYNCEPQRLWMSLGDSEFVSVILNSKLIIQTFHIIWLFFIQDNI